MASGVPILWAALSIGEKTETFSNSDGINDVDVYDVVFHILLNSVPKGIMRLKLLTKLRQLNRSWWTVVDISDDWFDLVWLKPGFRFWFLKKSVNVGEKSLKRKRQCPYHPLITFDDLLFNPLYCDPTEILFNRKVCSD